jgi:hypothetical protein
MVFQHQRDRGLCVRYHACSFLRNRACAKAKGDEGFVAQAFNARLMERVVPEEVAIRTRLKLE